jgi:mevalonate kinase
MIGYGKIILLGEHAVVYGKPGLAAGLSRGAHASAMPSAEPTLTVDPWSVEVRAARAENDPEREMLRRAFAAVLAGYAGAAPALRVEATVELPSGAGLGASAALSVAIVRALDQALGVSRDDAAVADLALAAERVFHGNPSGLDSALAAHGGVALFRKGQPLERVPMARPAWFVVAHSGESASTKETVASVARQRERAPEKVNQILDAIETVVLNGRTALETGNLDHLGQLMELNQKLLNTLLLSTARLEEMCTAAKSAGALGAKLTGGGGGGCMIALATDAPSAEKVRAALAAAGHDAFVTEVGAR